MKQTEMTPEIQALRNKLNSIVKSNGWIRDGRKCSVDGSFNHWFLDRVRKGLSPGEILNDFEKSKFSKDKSMSVDVVWNEIERVSLSYGWISDKTQKPSVDKTVRAWYAKQVKKDLKPDEILKFFYESKYSKQKEVKIVDETWIGIRRIAKANGWVNIKRDSVDGVVSLWYKSQVKKGFTPDEILRLFYESKFSQVKDIEVDLVWKEISKQATANGWIRSDDRGGVSKSIHGWYKRKLNRGYTREEVLELFYKSKYARTNPATYNDPAVLFELLEPVLPQVQEAMRQCCGFILGVGEHKESEAQVFQGLHSDLSKIIDDPIAVNAVVMFTKKVFHSPNK